MRLVNFDIASSIELVFNGKYWDLHNSAIFRTLQLLPDDNQAVMIWHSANAPCLPDRYDVKLVFEGLQFVEISARDTDLPLTEDTCVADILEVDPGARDSDPYLRAVLDFSDRFRLFFRFQGGRTIEIESDVVRFILFKREDSSI